VHGPDDPASLWCAKSIARWQTSSTVSTVLRLSPQRLGGRLLARGVERALADAERLERRADLTVHAHDA
jgi:hypothetical protein